MNNQELSERDKRLARLTVQERRVLSLVMLGRTYKEIGSELGLALSTIGTYKARILLKLNVLGLIELTRFLGPEWTGFSEVGQSLGLKEGRGTAEVRDAG